MLRPVTRKNTVDIAIDSIGEYITKNLRKGDVLPGEREIAEKLRISRNMTREALQHFRTLGIIESRPKIGATVARLTPDRAFYGYRPFLSIMEHSFQDLAQLRLMLEVGCAEAAVGRATAREIAGLEELCGRISDSFRKAAEGDKVFQNETFELDFEFHARIMRMSGNTIVESLIPLVIDFFSEQMRNNTASETMLVRTVGYREHYLMVDALKRRDLADLQSLIRSHISVYLAAVEKPETGGTL